MSSVPSLSRKGKPKRSSSKPYSSTGREHQHWKGNQKRSSSKPYSPTKKEHPQRSIHLHLLLFSTIGIFLAINYNTIKSWITAQKITSLNDPNKIRQDLLQKVRKSNSIQLSNRTLLATDSIPTNTLLIEIPRSLMIWDLDAVRHPFLQKELFQANLIGDVDTDNTTTTRRAALLSAYMALLRNEVISPVSSNTHVSIVKTLPLYEEYASFHPILVESSKLEQHLGGTYSPGYQQIVTTRDLIHSEYKKFTRVSPLFANLVTKEDYVAVRLAVQSRAFHISEITQSEALNKDGEMTLESEMEYYRQKTHIDFDDFAVSIMPVNDWMNSHAHNNVEVGEYDPISQTCRATSIQPIPQGAELINNYGDRYDMDLFSQYGYVPADGTGKTFARLYTQHDISVAAFQASKRPAVNVMLRYLDGDYGYRECIQKRKHGEAAELKRLKALYLQKISIDTERWVVSLPPRTTLQTTPVSTTVLPKDYTVPSFDEDKINEYLESEALKASLPCRLITLTHRDLDGDALSILQQDLEIMKNAEESSSSSSNELLKLEEVQIGIPWMARTLHCMHTLASTQKRRYGISVAGQTQKIIDMLSEDSSDIDSFEWNAAHLKLGELQSQEVVENFTMLFLESILMNYDVDGSSEDFMIRKEPCPWEYSMELFSD